MHYVTLLLSCTSGRNVSVFLERSVIDFRCVMVDHMYREKLIVRNGGKTAMKVSVQEAEKHCCMLLQI
jgi:hypothetical protein